MARRWRKKQRQHSDQGRDQSGNGGLPTRNGRLPLPAPSTSSLEEDLQQQRLRQRERQVEEEEERKGRLQAEEIDRENDGLEVDDGALHNVLMDASAPECFHNYKTIAAALRTTFLRSVSRHRQLIIPSSVLGYMQESSPQLTMRQRCQLRQRLHTSYLIENMTINSRASAVYDPKLKWLDHTIPDGHHCSWDFTCKYRLHGSARTIDVTMLGKDVSHGQTLPTIATVVQGGWGMFRPVDTSIQSSTPAGTKMWKQKYGLGEGDGSHGSVHTFRCPPVHAIRMHESSGRCGAIVRSPDRHSPYNFQMYPLPHATTYVETRLPDPVNDFCLGKDTALFACPRYRSSEPISPLFLPLEAGLTGATFRTLNVRNFPQSDALRVEMRCEGNDKFIAFGHRNGQVSLIDLRASQAVCAVLQYESAETDNVAPLGSVSDLGFLGDRSSNQSQVLVKRSFGSCQLHDLRMSSSSSSSSSSSASALRRGIFASSSSRKSMVCNMSAPSNKINSALSANCNGFAIDPIGRQTLLSPYMHSNGDACLGVWSMGTGDMIGSRVLLSNHEGGDVFFVEMSQCVTPSFAKGRSGGGSMSKFGVWLKCGAFTKSPINSKAGTLYHVSMPGHWEW